MPKVVRSEVVALMQELAEVKAVPAKAEEQLRRNSHNSSQRRPRINLSKKGA